MANDDDFQHIVYETPQVLTFVLSFNVVDKHPVPQ